MVKTVDVAEWYGLLCDSTHMESGEAFLREMDELISSNSSTEHDEDASHSIRYLRDLFQDHYIECRALIGFVLANKGQDVKFDDASFNAFKRHNIVGQMTPLSWAGMGTKQQECKQRIREVCNGILRLVGYDDVTW